MNRCTLGFHDWNGWSAPELVKWNRYIEPVIPEINDDMKLIEVSGWRQWRTCCICGKAQARTVNGSR